MKKLKDNSRKFELILKSTIKYCAYQSLMSNDMSKSLILDKYFILVIVKLKEKVRS